MTDVYIESEAWSKLWAYITSVPTEIGGMGYAYQEGSCLVWKDTFLMPQVATYGEVDFDVFGGDEYAINRAAEDGFLGSENGVWISWHSHNKMGVFWSDKDDKRIEKLRLAGIKYLLSFVGNHKFEYKLRLDYFDVNHHGMSIPQITQNDLRLHLDPQDQLFATVSKDIEENLRERPKPDPLSVPSKGGTSKPGADGKVKQINSGDPGKKVQDALDIKNIMDELEVDFETAKQIHEAGWTAEMFMAALVAQEAERDEDLSNAILEGAH